MNSSADDSMRGQAPDGGDADDNAAALFRDAMRDVTPLRQDKVTLQSRRPAPRPRMTEADERAALREMAQDFPNDAADIETDGEALFQRQGVQHRVMEKLRRGRLRVEAELDLHGCTIDTAKAELALFLRRCRQSGKRCVRVIHGKGLGSPQGKPILKRLLPGWLRQRDEVLAYCPATRADGGSGALYVLLKAVRS